jgi:hypothetical protein
MVFEHLSKYDRMAVRFVARAEEQSDRGAPAQAVEQREGFSLVRELGAVFACESLPAAGVMAVPAAQRCARRCGSASEREYSWP